MKNSADPETATATRLVVDVVSDLICPWCFVAKRRLERTGALLARPLDIRWHPFQLNPTMPREGTSRRGYRSAKFGSWERSRQLDAQVAAAGTEVGIEFRHDLMERTPNTVRGHVLLAAALRQGVEIQNRVAERLFTGYFTSGEDVGDPRVLVGMARECGVDAIAQPEDLDDPSIVHEVHAEEQEMRLRGIQGVPLITFQDQVIASGAQREEVLAAALREIAANSEECRDGFCTVQPERP
ncbi:MAG TPA: DsbA family oxidoreductase [Bryobacteraceae bacterium]|nr:DsbA family oxidoreductase [Bryobacteraceae bacterium]